MDKVLKKYDRMLFVERALDGTLNIKRKSPFSNILNHKVLTLGNEFFGSGKWVIDRLVSMDFTRRNIIKDVFDNNKKIKEGKSEKNVHSELADFFESDCLTFVN